MAADTVVVSWLGSRPDWLDAEEARSELAGVELRPASANGGRSVLHVAPDALAGLNGRPANGPLVVDLSGVERLGRGEARAAAEADLVLVDDPRRLGLLRGRPLPAWVELRPPLDLRAFAPEAALHADRDSALKRFRRLHRLTPRTVLFAGPYTETGGLDRALDAALTLRSCWDDLVLAAIPDGPVDPRYRDRCERRALELGHRGILEWQVDEAELPLWYALSAVVCTPATAPVPGRPARLAAAAARPFVGTAAGDPDGDVVDGVTGYLVPPGDAALLAERLSRLLADPPVATAFGAAARSRVELRASPAEAARHLKALWIRAADAVRA